MGNKRLRKTLTGLCLFFQQYFQLRGLIVVVYLLIPQFVYAAFWIDDYSGAAEDYQLIRQGKIHKVEAQNVAEGR